MKTQVNADARWLFFFTAISEENTAAAHPVCLFCFVRSDFCQRSPISTMGVSDPENSYFFLCVLSLMSAAPALLARVSSRICSAGEVRPKPCIYG